MFGGSSTGALAPIAMDVLIQLVEHTVQFVSKITQNHVELGRPRNRRDNCQVPAALGVHRTQSFARFEHSLDEYDVLVLHLQAPNDQIVADQFVALHCSLMAYSRRRGGASKSSSLSRPSPSGMLGTMGLAHDSAINFGSPPPASSERDD